LLAWIYENRPAKFHQGLSRQEKTILDRPVQFQRLTNEKADGAATGRNVGMSINEAAGTAGHE
jgi:hypothetical protein